MIRDLKQGFVKSIRLAVITAGVMVSAAVGGIVNGGFESGTAGWTQEGINDGSNLGSSYNLVVTDYYHYSGNYALSGYAEITGDEAAGDDWTRAYAWTGVQDLTGVTSIRLYATDFQSSWSHYSSGYGQELFLVLDDGTNRAAALLWDDHEPIYTSLYDEGLYTASAGADGRTWYRFDVLMNASYFGAGLASVDLTKAKAGLCWEAMSWNGASQTLWMGAAVDDVTFVPEPMTAAMLGLGGLALLRKRKR